MKNYRSIVLVVLSIAIVVLGFQVNNRQNTIEKNQTESEQVDILLRGPNKVAGYSCGVLSPEVAESVLGTSSLKLDFDQGPTNTIRDELAPKDNTFWVDSCRYNDIGNSNVYAELFVISFQTDELAESAFPDFIQEVNEPKEVPSEGYGQKLVYSGGLYTLLNKNRVIQLSASGGNPSSIEEFSKSVLDEIISKL